MSEGTVIKYVEQNHVTAKPKRIHSGQSLGFDKVLKDAEKDKKNFEFYTFVSTRRNPIFYMTFDDVLEFKNFSFKTHIKAHADFLNELPLAGVELFQNEYPKEVMEIMRKERDTITRIKESGDGGE